MHFKFSYVLALAMTGGVALWMATGTVVRGGEEDNPNSTPPPAERQSSSGENLFKVQVTKLVARDRSATLEIHGRTEAHAKVQVQAETAAVVISRPTNAGEQIAKGDVLCQLDAGTRQAKVLEAEANLAQAELNFKAADRLSQNGYTAQTTLAAQQAGLNAAKARLQEAQEELKWVTVRSPIDGIIESPMADVGTRLNVGDTCATVVDFNPMIAIGQVSERNIGKLSLGMPAEVKLISGQTVQGALSYIGPAADPDTRTFRIEVEIDNHDGTTRDGLTALTRIVLPSEKAHLIDSSILTLNDDGQVGVRAVSDDNVTQFHPVSVMGGGDDGMWVKGLPDTLDVITVGQDYVKDGEKVQPVFKTAEAAQ
ncbi:efflux RND transporter periplasmic adaptor subunit [Roseibium sp. CAU 1637]|uniref:Efflux RND transporter periplasmic adaptor subunit n=1 Tax=Roseibium limicola TaxID=2816037 RepID=A0A939EQA8_9HYPH|nr:efflux RND transporter periplasmic adaptor subunit [Roseibium limicola]MBO0346127.1 efflux RND transporter periplasmic adaptor subunit [Roseibium limicola]